MFRLSLKSLGVVSVVSLLAACAQPATEEESAAPAAEEPIAAVEVADPTVVDAAHYTAELENDRVRVVRIRYGPGESSVMHHHPAAVAVFLTDHHVSFELPDGSTEEVHKSKGETLVVPAGDHLPTNIGEEPWEVLLVELKGGEAGTPAGEPVGADPIDVDPDHYRVAAENDEVRVLEISYGPGETSVMHDHSEGVAVFVTDHHVSFETPDGSTQEVHKSAGEHMWLPAGPHLPTNMGEEPLKVLLVELK